MEDPAVESSADVACRAPFGDQVAVLALPVPDHRRQNHRHRGVRTPENVIHDLFGGLGLYLGTALVAIRVSDSRKEKPKVIAHLRYRSHRRSRIAADGSLIDGGGRRKSLDVIHAGPLHLTQELASVRGQ